MNGFIGFFFDIFLAIQLIIGAATVAIGCAYFGYAGNLPAALICLCVLYACVRVAHGHVIKAFSR